MDSGGRERENTTRLVATRDTILYLTTPQRCHTAQRIEFRAEQSRTRRVGRLSRCEVIARLGPSTLVHHQRSYNEVNGCSRGRAFWISGLCVGDQALQV